MQNSRNSLVYCALIISSLLILLPDSATARPFVLVLSQDDLKDSPADSSSPSPDDPSVTDWDEFGDSDARSDDELDPGSWRLLFEPTSAFSSINTTHDPITKEYYSAVRKMVIAMSQGEPRLMDEAASEIEAAASKGYPHAQSVMGFLYNMGITKERSGTIGLNGWIYQREYRPAIKPSSWRSDGDA